MHVYAYVCVYVGICIILIISIIRNARNNRVSTRRVRVVA